MPQVDTIKAIFTYVAALVILVGGGVFLYATLDNQAAESSRIVVAGFMGSAITFLFGQESATRATRAAAAATAAASPTPPTA